MVNLGYPTNAAGDTNLRHLQATVYIILLPAIEYALHQFLQHLIIAVYITGS